VTIENNQKNCEKWQHLIASILIRCCCSHLYRPWKPWCKLFKIPGLESTRKGSWFWKIVGKWDV